MVFIRTKVADRRKPAARILQREFANQKALVAYAEQNAASPILWEGMHVFAKRQRLLSPLPAFTKRQQQLSPEQYEIVDVRTSTAKRAAKKDP